MSIRPFFPCVIASAFLLGELFGLPRQGTAAEKSPPLAEQQAFFELKVRPLLVERCYACHAESKQVKGGLALDTRRGWERGGDSGPALVPGKPDESRIIQAVRYDDLDLQMPPSGRLKPGEISILEEWVRRGAPDPRDGVALVSQKPTAPQKSAPPHWAFQPLRKTVLPAVRDAAWGVTEVDAFILAKLEQQGLTPTPDADRHTWLRRVTLDLTGLPPTPAEIELFLADHSANAWERVVDKLLASRAFGERWARPWLDLVGYADQIGSANDVPAEHAWRYRDYVIRSLNADKPFDVFVREQLAGDLLTATTVPQRQDQLTATGFLLLGNVNIVEDDKLVMRMDLVDAQIEKVGKAFLAMTLNCTRCHDHKFDPITMRDYYGLAGIFASTESTYKDVRGVWSSVSKSPLPETLEEFTAREASLREYAARVAAVQKERTTASARLKQVEQQLKSLPPGGTSRASLEQEQAALVGKVKAVDKRLQHLGYVRPAEPVAFSAKENPEIADARMQVRGNPHVLGDAIPRGFVQIASQGAIPAIPTAQSGRLQLAEWLTGSASPLVARVTVNRFWQKLFGRGIVGSVDYFGLRGEAPSHPELLDALAERFIHDGWSQKRLLRKLVLSRVYRQSARPNRNSPNGLASDPENRWLWRMSPRRLEAEMIRDAALAASGVLERTAGGPALAPEFSENVGGLDPANANPISFSLTKFRENQWRVRTVYLPVVRSAEQQGPGEVLNFFDFPQPARMSGGRPTTTVASQALFLLNGPLLKEATRKLVSRLLSDSLLKTDEARLQALYLSLLNRPPTAEDLAVAREFLEVREGPAPGSQGDADLRSTRWRQMAQALLASNEFLFRL